MGVFCVLGKFCSLVVFYCEMMLFLCMFRVLVGITVNPLLLFLFTSLFVTESLRGRCRPCAAKFVENRLLATTFPGGWILKLLTASD